MPAHAGLAYTAAASSLFSSCFPHSDVDSLLVHLSASLDATESLQPYHIDCELSRLPLCHCDASTRASHSSLWSSAVRHSSAAIAELLDEQYRPEKHKLSPAAHSRASSTRRSTPAPAADGSGAVRVTLSVRCEQSAPDRFHRWPANVVAARPPAHNVSPQRCNSHHITCAPPLSSFHRGPSHASAVMCRCVSAVGLCPPRGSADKLAVPFVSSAPPTVRRPPADSHTDFLSDVSGVCALCGVTEPNAVRSLRRNLVQCAECGVCAHVDCFTPPLALRGQDEFDRWRCADCALCGGCGERRAGETMLLCEKCGGGWHAQCSEQTVRIRKRKNDSKQPANESTRSREEADGQPQRQQLEQRQQQQQQHHQQPQPSTVFASLCGLSAADVYFICSECCYVPPMSAEEKQRWEDERKLRKVREQRRRWRWRAQEKKAQQREEEKEASGKASGKDDRDRPRDKGRESSKARRKDDKAAEKDRRSSQKREQRRREKKQRKRDRDREGRKHRHAAAQSGDDSRGDRRRKRKRDRDSDRPRDKDKRGKQDGSDGRAAKRHKASRLKSMDGSGSSDAAASASGSGSDSSSDSDDSSSSGGVSEAGAAGHSGSDSNVSSVALKRSTAGRRRVQRDSGGEADESAEDSSVASSQRGKQGKRNSGAAAGSDKRQQHTHSKRGRPTQ